MKLYASPKGIATMTMSEGMKWSRRPEEGEPKGQLEAQKVGKGMTPSLASSWLTRACANVTVITLPKADNATRTLISVRLGEVIGIGKGPHLRARLAAVPKTFPIKYAATVVPLLAISSGVAAA